MQLSDRIGRRMRLKDLHILMTVGQTGSMRKAAALLNSSQPAISRSIADLENAIGVRLLERTPQGVIPSAYGRALLDGGAAMFDDLRQAVKNIEFLADPTLGEVRIGTTSSLAAGLLTAAIERLNGLHPKLRFHVMEGDIIALQDQLHRRDIDFAIGPLQQRITDEGLKSEVLFEDRLVVVAGGENKWLCRRKIKLSELLNEPWVFPPVGTLAWSLISNAFHGSGVDTPKAIVSSNSARLNNNLLASGRFLAIFQESMMKFSANRMPFKILPVDMPSLPRSVALLTVKNRALNPAPQLFIECLRQLARPWKKGK